MTRAPFGLGRGQRAVGALLGIAALGLTGVAAANAAAAPARVNQPVVRAEGTGLCQNRQLGLTVQVPTEWRTSRAMPDSPAFCTIFDRADAPEDIDGQPTVTLGITHEPVRHYAGAGTFDVAGRSGTISRELFNSEDAPRGYYNYLFTASLDDGYTLAGKAHVHFAVGDTASTDEVEQTIMSFAKNLTAKRPAGGWQATA